MVEKEIEGQNKRLREEAAKGERLALPSGFAPKISRDLCVGSTLQPPPYSGETAPGTFAGLVAEADGILEARVTAVEPGFLQGLPASLLEVQVTKAFRTSARYAKTDTFYVFHPFARFALGGNSFCNSASVPPPDAPEGSSVFEPVVGGRVLLFVFGPPLDRGGVLITPLPEQILYESPQGELSLPEKLKRDDELHPATSLDEIEKLVIAALRPGTGPEKPANPERADGTPKGHQP
jgi:hypothetical protein